MAISKRLYAAAFLAGFAALLSPTSAHELTTETMASGIKLQNDQCGEQDAYFRIDTLIGQSRTIRLEPRRTLFITVAKGDKMIMRCGKPPENAPTEYIRIDHNHGEYDGSRS